VLVTVRLEEWLSTTEPGLSIGFPPSLGCPLFFPSDRLFSRPPFQPFPPSIASLWPPVGRL